MKAASKPAVIERVVREYVQVPIEAPRDPYEAVSAMLRTQAMSERDRKRALYESWKIV